MNGNEDIIDGRAAELDESTRRRLDDAASLLRLARLEAGEDGPTRPELAARGARHVAAGESESRVVGALHEEVAALRPRIEARLRSGRASVLVFDKWRAAVAEELCEVLECTEDFARALCEDHAEALELGEGDRATSPLATARRVQVEALARMGWSA